MRAEKKKLQMTKTFLKKVKFIKNKTHTKKIQPLEV